MINLKIFLPPMTAMPVIEGLTVNARPGRWTCATDGRRFYIVGATVAFWLLFEIEWDLDGMRFKRTAPDGVHVTAPTVTIQRDQFTELASK